MTLLTSDVDDDITVGELGDGLRNDRFTASESTGNRDSTALYAGEQSVQDSLTDNEGVAGRQLLGGGSRNTHRPYLHHAVLALGAVEIDFEDFLVDGVLALGGNLGDGAPCSRG